MVFVWHPVGVFGVLAWALTWTLAAVVRFKTPPRAMNRRLALLLFIEGGAALTGSGLLYFVGSEDLAYRVQLVSTGLQIALPPLYLYFLATLRTPLVRPLRTAPAKGILLTFTLGAEALFLARPELFVRGMRPVWFAEWESLQGPLWPAIILGLLAVSLFGLATSISAYRRAPRESALGERAKGFAIAFGARDTLIVASLLVPTLLAPVFPSRLWDLSGAVSMTLVFMLYVPLIVYSSLRHQLLDIDLRIKWTLERGTIATVFVALYVVVSQAASTLLVPVVGPWLGILAVALLAFAIVPLRRLAEGLSGAILPEVEDSPAYLDQRRLDVYKAALEQAYESGSGTISQEEESLLTVLRDKLGITDRDHAVLDFAVRAAWGAGRSDADLARGTGMLGKFRILEDLAAGASSSTFLAEDTLLDRRVVVKALRHGGGRREAVLREARRVAMIRHPNVVTIYEVEEVGDRAFIVMEYVEGGSLQDRLRRGALRHAEFRRVAAGLLSALEAVHSAGLIHRDVKPSNVLLAGQGEPKLADFGVAFEPDVDATAGGEGDPGAVGTIRYMSPEQARGWRVTHRSDLYSGATTLFEAYTGEPYFAPLPNESAVELQMRVAAAGPFEREIHGPRSLIDWFARALDPSPDARFDSAREMHEALEAVVAP